MCLLFTKHHKIAMSIACIMEQTKGARCSLFGHNITAGPFRQILAVILASSGQDRPPKVKECKLKLEYFHRQHPMSIA